MQFHQQPCECIRDNIIKTLLEKYMVIDRITKEGISMDDMKNVLSWESIQNSSNMDSDTSDEEFEVNQDIFSDNLEDNELETNESTEKIVSKSKGKKHKKEKGEPKRAPSSFVYFKSHPDAQDVIIEASKQLQGEDDKKPGDPIGKVKGAGIVWGTLSEEEKEVWKQRSKEAFELKNQ